MLKILSKIVIYACLMTNIFPNFLQKDNYISNDETNISSKDHSLQLNLYRQLQSLYDVRSFEVNYEILNARSKEIMGRINILADNQSGNAIIHFESSNRANNPRSQKFTMYVYNYFEDVYINLTDWLRSMGYFKQAYFSINDDEKMNAIKHLWVRFDQEHIRLNSPIKDYVEPFLLLPDKQSFLQFHSKRIYQVEPIWLLFAERIQIPERLFHSISQMKLVFNTTVSMENDLFRIHPRLIIGSQAEMMQVKANVQSFFDKRYLPSNEKYGLLADREMPANDFELAFNGATVLPKLTHFQAAFNENTLKYTLNLQGIVENFNLNLFNDEPSNFKAYDFSVNYQFQPKEWLMPEKNNLKFLTVDDYNETVHEKIFEKGSNH